VTTYLSANICKEELIDLFHFIKRFTLCMGLVITLLIAFPLAVQAAAAITAFHMDRTTVQSGQTITITVHTSGDTTHLFAEISGTRTQGTQISVNNNTGVRTWNITLTPAAGATRVDIFANTSNSIVGAVSISIPITVTGAGTTVNPPGVVHSGLAIVSITEIAALAPQQVRMEIVTGLEVAEVWVHHSENRYPRGVRVSSDATTQTWHVNLLGLTPWQQTVTVSANRTFHVTGATNQSYTLRHTAPFVAPTNPLIISASVNPVQVVLGGTSTVTLSTNADVNHVWMMVNGARVNATRTTTTATGVRNWTAIIAPTTTGNITIHANATDTAVGAATRNVWVEALQTRVVISHASAAWVYNANNVRTGVRVLVHTNLEATDVWLNVGNRLNLSFPSHTRSGNTRVWDHVFSLDGFANNQIHIHASDMGNIFTGTGNNAHVSLTGVGGQFVSQPPQGSSNQGVIWNASTNPAQISGSMFWAVSVTFTTPSDITEVRIRDTEWNIVGTATSQFTEGANNTRIWTVHNVRPVLATGTANTSLTVQVRRGGTSWTDVSPVINVPVHW
jgi:hypothetical protein